LGWQKNPKLDCEADCKSQNALRGLNCAKTAASENAIDWQIIYSSWIELPKFNDEKVMGQVFYTSISHNVFGCSQQAMLSLMCQLILRWAVAPVSSTSSSQVEPQRASALPS